MKNSESAFPVQRQLREDGDVITYAEVGLTKREYFAAMAMQGLLVDPGEASWQYLAASAVRAADELLIALAKQT